MPLENIGEDRAGVRYGKRICFLSIEVDVQGLSVPASHITPLLDSSQTLLDDVSGYDIIGPRMTLPAW